MSTEIKKEIQLEIAHVLFIDIVGYSKLLINQQSEQLHKLKKMWSPSRRKNDFGSPDDRHLS
jgi:hypothetical protein